MRKEGRGIKINPSIADDDFFIDVFISSGNLSSGFATKKHLTAGDTYIMEGKPAAGPYRVCRGLPGLPGKADQYRQSSGILDKSQYLKSHKTDIPPILVNGFLTNQDCA
jgi:hypothetical protein